MHGQLCSPFAIISHSDSKGYCPLSALQPLIILIFTANQ
jgi:hypothetical protein